MALEKWNPLRELDAMRREMDRIWEDIFPRKGEQPWKRQAAAQDQAAAAPAIDIIDRNDEVVVRAEMPGVPKESIDVSFQDNTLTLKGEIKEEASEKEGNYSYSERNYRYYLRSVNIPFKIRQNDIKAGLKDGVLSVHLPKVLEEQPRKINVEIS